MWWSQRQPHRVHDVTFGSKGTSSTIRGISSHHPWNGHSSRLLSDLTAQIKNDITAGQRGALWIQVSQHCDAAQLNVCAKLCEVGKRNRLKLAVVVPNGASEHAKRDASLVLRPLLP